VLLAVIAGWFVTLATGRLPAPLHNFFCAYTRYAAHLTAYLGIVANPYPPFTGEAGAYPIDVRLPEPAVQARWKTLLRAFLALPALLVLAVIGGFSFGGSETLQTVVAILGWFMALVLGRMGRGLRDAGAYAVGYTAQVTAYMLLVTDRYPNSDPMGMLEALEPPPLHPVHLVGDPDDLRRSRVTVLFRLPLVIPHVIWLALWTVVALLAAIVQWFVTLVTGAPAAPLHAFLTRYVRYGFHVYAFGSLAANPFPGFTGTPGRYPLDLALPAPTRQNRWKTGFRGLLAVPAFIVNWGLGGGLLVAAFLTWFAALATGTAPWGLRNLSAYALRYQGQVNAYLYLLTDAYPHASPLEGADAAPPAEA
jgi:hypothetical protein